jgi:hypothetical protein
VEDAADKTPGEVRFVHEDGVAADVRRLKSKPKTKVSLVTSAATKYELLLGKIE